MTCKAISVEFTLDRDIEVTIICGEDCIGNFTNAAERGWSEGYEVGKEFGMWDGSDVGWLVGCLIKGLEVGSAIGCTLGW